MIKKRHENKNIFKKQCQIGISFWSFAITSFLRIPQMTTDSSLFKSFLSIHAPNPGVLSRVIDPPFLY